MTEPQSTAHAEELQRRFMETTRQPTLFEIVEAMRAVLQRVDEAEGEVDEDVALQLDTHAVSIEQKAESYAALYRSLHEDAEASERFALHYKERAARKRAQANALKARLAEAMQLLGLRKIATPTATAAFQRNSQPSLELTVPEADALRIAPAELVRRELNTAATKAALQRGAKLTFARLVQGEHLRFR